MFLTVILLVIGLALVVWRVDFWANRGSFIANRSNISNLAIALLALLSSCISSQSVHKEQLGNGYYSLYNKQKSIPHEKVYVTVVEDSVKVFAPNRPARVIENENEFLVIHSFDVDVMTVPFKYRPSASGFPRQLNTTFNGNAYVGYRIDRFQPSFKQTPAGISKGLRHKAISIGAFGGLGSASINPWTTNNQITDEYDGLVVTRGLALFIGINSVTVGLATGWDYLTDRDKSIWIYQNKPWYGIAIGLNLN